MPELEGVESWGQGSRRRLRGASLWLGLLDGLGLVSRTLLVTASSSTVSSLMLTSSLAITLLLFEGWLIWTMFYRAELVVIVMTFWYVFRNGLSFFKLFKLYFHLGLITTPHDLYVHMTYVYSFSHVSSHTITWPREVIIVL